mgnify:CR=1 FL=1
MMRAKTRRNSAAGQSGLTLIGLLFWGILVAMVALVVIRVLPTINEFTTIQRAVKKLAQESPGTVPEIRAAFEQMCRKRMPKCMRGHALVQPRLPRRPTHR